ncbi:MAG TPA: hypothetical protein VHN98_00890 [Acidimicrobiales bacterium]|nr:hypothetical protein [Acidimicrobiales bacterium]
MNNVAYVLSALSALAAAGVIMLVVRTWHEPATPAAHTAVTRIEKLGGIALLAVGAVAFAATAVTPSEDITGPGLLPPAVLLAALAVLGWRRPAVAARFLLWSAALVVPLTFVLGLVVSGSREGRPAGATLSNASGATAFVVLGWVFPAVLTGLLLRRAASPAPPTHRGWQAATR